MARRVLAVQIRPEITRVARATFADAGFEAIVVAGGPAAVSAVESWAPEVVLIDLTRAALDGWYVLAAVGARPVRPLLVVRVADASEAERAIALGADAWAEDDLHAVSVAGKLASQIAA